MLRISFKELNVASIAMGAVKTRIPIVRPVII
jgi:hypothetical protein